MDFWEDFKTNEDLAPHDSKKLILYVLSLVFGIEDITTLETEAITDGSDDKKIDALYIDQRTKTVVIAQSTMPREAKEAAPANKAANLQTAASWALTSTEIEKIPERLRPNIAELRDLIEKDEIKRIEFWYTHNCKESKNVKNELNRVEEVAVSLLKQNYPQANIAIGAKEFGLEKLRELYKKVSQEILVNGIFEVECEDGGYLIKSNDWDAYCTTIKSKWLREKYRQYNDDLFSANIRGYLDYRDADQNINNGIMQTYNNEPENLWVFNNGITCLVNEFKVTDKNTIKIRDISIVNGAQTTGAISHSDEEKNAKILVRFVKCKNKETVKRIIEYNNTQNKIEAPDFRSNDAIQKKLRIDFDRIPQAKYSGRRGGCINIRSRDPELIPREAIAQSLTAFHGDPLNAYNRKTKIWIDDGLYANVFNSDLTPEHVVFAYSLLRAIEQKKQELRKKGEERTEEETKQNEFLRERGSHILILSSISQSLEVLSEQKIVNKFKISFGKVSPKDAINNWKPIIDACLPIIPSTLKGGLTGGLRSNEKIKNAIELFNGTIGTLVKVSSDSQNVFKVFQKKLEYNN